MKKYKKAISELKGNIIKVIPEEGITFNDIANKDEFIVTLSSGLLIALDELEIDKKVINKRDKYFLV